MFQTGKGTRQVRLRKRRVGGKRVRFGVPDESLTGSGGAVALAELSRKLRVVRSLDAGIGVVKQRDRGVSGGQMVAALAQCHLTWLTIRGSFGTGQ